MKVCEMKKENVEGIVKTVMEASMREAIYRGFDSIEEFMDSVEYTVFYLPTCEPKYIVFFNDFE